MHSTSQAETSEADFRFTRAWAREGDPSPSNGARGQVGSRDPKKTPIKAF